MEPATNINSREGGERWFATTHWSVVLCAGQEASPGASQALETLCRAYWYPLYAYIRRKGHTEADAQDATQSFFALLLRREDVRRADRAKGRFRSFLLAAVNHFLADEWRRGQREKRGGGQIPVSLEAEFDTGETRYRLEQASEQAPDKAFDRGWALTLLDRAFTRLQEEFAAAGKARQFDALKPFLSAEAEDGSYAALAEALGQSPGAVSVAVHRLRQRYGEFVREEIAHTVSSKAEIDEEMRYLFSLLS